jgi:type I restriction enzyme M protein
MSARNTVKSIQDIMRQDVGVDGDAQRLSQLCWMFFLKIIDDQDQQFEVMQDNYRSPIPENLQWRTWAADPEGITGDALLAFINTELFPTLKELPITGANANRSRVVRSVFEDAYNYMKSGQLMRQVINKISSVDFNDLAERKHFGDIYEQLLNDLQSAGNAGEYYTPRAVTAFMVDRIDPKPGETLFDPSCGTGGFLTCSIRHMRERYVKKVEDEQALQAGLRAVEKKQLPHMLCVTNMLLHGIEDPSFVRHDNTLAQPYISYGQSDRVDIILTNPPFGGREEDGIESNFPTHLRTKETADLFLALFIRLLKPGGRAAIAWPCLSFGQLDESMLLSMAAVMLHDMGSDFELLGELTDIEIIVVHLSVRERRQLRDQFGGRRWRKLKGIGCVRFPNGAVRLAEVHWYEAHGVGRRKMKVKRVLD